MMIIIRFELQEMHGQDYNIMTAGDAENVS